MGKRVQTSIDKMISQPFLSILKCIDVYSISTLEWANFLQILSQISQVAKILYKLVISELLKETNFKRIVHAFKFEIFYSWPSHTKTSH